jgi:hypothetical protein
LDWIERLKIASKVRGYNEMKLFKSTKLNMWGKTKDWFKKWQPILVY